MSEAEGRTMKGEQMSNGITLGEGKPIVQDFDVSNYSDYHDVPALWIGDQIVQLGDGYRNPYGGTDPSHWVWKLDPDKTYRVIIEVVDYE